MQQKKSKKMSSVCIKLKKNKHKKICSVLKIVLFIIEMFNGIIDGQKNVIVEFLDEF